MTKWREWLCDQIVERYGPGELKRTLNAIAEIQADDERRRRARKRRVVRPAWRLVQ